MTYVGEIAHELPRRIRIKVAAAGEDAAFFDRLVEDVASAPHVVEVRANARAGSLTVCGDGANGPVRATLEQAGLFEFHAPPPVRARERERRGIDPDAVLAIALSGLGLVQIVRGRGTGAASENFWNAFRTQGHLRNRGAALALAALGLIQLGRGRYLNSASSLFYYALTARQLMRERAPSGRSRPGRSVP
jgi:hypothetical protein